MPNTLSSQAPRSLATVLLMAEKLPALVGAHEIAALLNVSRQRVSQLAATADFPHPAAELQAGRIWLKSDVIAWALRKGRAVQHK